MMSRARESRIPRDQLCKAEALEGGWGWGWAEMIICPEYKYSFLSFFIISPQWVPAWLHTQVEKSLGEISLELGLGTFLVRELALDTFTQAGCCQVSESW
jgi:hypothetical protein